MALLSHRTIETNNAVCPWTMYSASCLSSTERGLSSDPGYSGTSVWCSSWVGRGRSRPEPSEWSEISYCGHYIIYHPWLSILGGSDSSDDRSKEWEDRGHRYSPVRTWYWPRHSGKCKWLTPEVEVDDGTTYSFGCLPPSFQSTGWSALFFSAEKGDVPTTESLLKAGANAALEDKVPFHMCVG